MTEAFKKEFGELMALKGMTPNEHLSVLLACLGKYNLKFLVPSINPNLFLTHKNNRGGLLLSPHNVHRNGAKIHASGANMKNLSNALCFELGSSGSLRQQHIEKNQELIARADGLLAPINGTERYVSVGCGHTVAFCKTVQNGGVTNQPELQAKGSNRIDTQKICMSADFDTMVNRGWTWEVIPACVDETFPEFSTIAQRALNTQNHTNTAISELECMMTIEASLTDPGFRAMPNFKELALDNISAMAAPCSSYAASLLEFVSIYGGGPGAPFIKFMDSVAKGFGCNVSLGSAYWAGLASAQFPDKTSMFPLIRIAMALANMTSDKIEDGVAKLLSRADVNKVTVKAKSAEASEAEAVLQDCMEIAAVVGGIDAMIKPLGLVFSRMGLKLCQREKAGREGKVYTMDELKAMFLADTSKLLKNPVKFDKWQVKSEAAKAAGGEPKQASQSTKLVNPASLKDHSDPVWVVGQAGFKIGSVVMEKQTEYSPEALYTIMSVDKNIGLHQAISYTGSPMQISITMSELMTNWVVRKDELPIAMDQAPGVPKSISMEVTKGEVTKAILAVAENKTKHSMLAYYRRPDELRATCKINVKALVLAPVCSASHIGTKNTTSNAGVKIIARDALQLFALPVPKPAAQKDNKWGEHDLVTPFWWLVPVHDKNKANMTLDSIVQNGITVPVYMNMGVVPAHTKLTYYVKPKAKFTPLQNAVKADAAGEEGDQSKTGSVAKKAKRS